MALVPRWVRQSLGAVLVLAALPTNAESQADPDSVRLRNDCRLAAQILSKGQPAVKRSEALATIGRCGAEAVPALERAWEDQGADIKELQLLVTATRNVAAPGLAGALMGRLSDESSAVASRTAALLVLLTYADPYMAPGFETLLVTPEEAELRRYGPADHSVGTVGRESLGQDFAGDLKRVLLLVAESDASAQMRGIARLALRHQPFRPER